SGRSVNTSTWRKRYVRDIAPSLRNRPDLARRYWTRWTGDPRMATAHVVVSLPPPTVYSIFHQPASDSPEGVRPLEPYVFGSETSMVRTRSLKKLPPDEAVWICVTLLPEVPLSAV